MLATRSVLRGASRAQQLLQRSSSSIALPGVPRRLADVAKLELLEAEQPAALAAIWEKYHENRPELSGSCVPAAEHAQIVERGRESPLFIFPVRREQGHFMLLSQFDVQHSVFVMTFLEDYKRNPAAAQPWLSVTLFDELMDSKGLGLLRVEVRASSPSRSLSVAVLLTDRPVRVGRRSRSGSPRQRPLTSCRWCEDTTEQTTTTVSGASITCETKAAPARADLVGDAKLTLCVLLCDAGRTTLQFRDVPELLPVMLRRGKD